MPTQADLKRNKMIRDYFRDVYVGKISDPNDAREDIQRRFGVETAHWHRLRPQFKDMIAMASMRQSLPAAGPGQTEEHEPVVVEIPSDLTGDAKDAMNRLLEENHRLATEATLKDVELATLRSQLAACQGRIKTLREASQVLLNSI